MSRRPDWVAVAVAAVVVGGLLPRGPVTTAQALAWTLAVQRRPELFHAWIGTGQLVDQHAVFVSNNNDAVAVAAAHSVDPYRWIEAFAEVVDRIASRSAR